MDKRNQRQVILDALKRGEKLSSLSAWTTYSVSRLSARIAELRAAGYKIQGDMKKSKNQFGEPTHFMEYSYTETEGETQ